MLKNKNFALSALAADLAIGGATLTVATGEGVRFPATGTFRAVLWDSSYGSPVQDLTREIVTVELNAGDVFNITRAQEETSAKAWALGSKFAHVLTAGKIDEIEAGGGGDFLVMQVFS